MDIFGTAGGLWAAKENREFAEEMASTQYQRAVADMKAAGLNPMAIYGGGGGASPAAAPGGQANNPVGAGNSAKAVIDVYDAVQTARKDTADADAAEAAARVAASEAEVVTRENSAYKTALESDAGKAAATFKKYQAQGPMGWVGGAGALHGLGVPQTFGGWASAKAKDAWKEAKYAAGVYD